MTNDFWSDGELYERYTGRWSRLIANEFIAWLGIEGSRLENCIDMGCGTGALSEALLANAVCESLTCFDLSPAYLSLAKKRIQSKEVEFLLGDGQNTLLPSGKYCGVVSGLAVNFVESPEKMLSEMRRLGRSGATLGLYIWDFADGMKPIRMFWDAAHECRAPDVEELDSANLFPICQRENLLESISEAGWLEPEVAPVEIDARFENFDDYWTPFLSGQGTAPAFAVGLGEEVREKVRQTLCAMVTHDSNEPFVLRTSAWGAKGIAP